MEKISKITLSRSIREFKEKTTLGQWWLVTLPYALGGSLAFTSIIIIIGLFLREYNQVFNNMVNFGGSMCFLHLLFSTLSVRSLVTYYKTNKRERMLRLLFNQPALRDLWLFSHYFWTISLTIFLIDITMETIIIPLMLVFALMPFLGITYTLALYISAYHPKGYLPTFTIYSRALKLARKYFVKLIINAIANIFILFISTILIVPLIWIIPYTSYHTTRLVTAILDEDGLAYIE